MPLAIATRSEISTAEIAAIRKVPRPAPQRHIMSMPRDPVDEEQNVARFFLDHGLESFDERSGKIARVARGVEKAEREEAVDALAVARAYPGPSGSSGGG